MTDSFPLIQDGSQKSDPLLLNAFEAKRERILC
jgi:hypothetical protein